MTNSMPDFGELFLKTKICDETKSKNQPPTHNVIMDEID